MRFFSYPNIVGLLLGTVFFAFSLTPSLLPRPFLIQGVLSGLSFTVGYGVGITGVWLWYYLQLPVFQSRWSFRLKMVAMLLCVLFAISFIWQASTWQNALRSMMGMEPSTGIQPIMLGLIAGLVFLVALGLARLFKWIMHSLAIRWRRYVPDRISYMTSFLVAAVLFWSVIDGVLMKGLLRAADSSFQQLDSLIDDDMPLPALDIQTGSSASLISWKELGRQGRRFVAEGPTTEDLSAYFNTPLPTPIRVYVGLESAETPELRAKLALEELKRVGGFERSVLLLVTPTGTGWIDSDSLDTFEYLHRGDVATVAAQYSYLNSPLTMLTAAKYGEEAARALFTEIYGHWRTLPRDTRPRLYLSGMSLGSLNSDLSFDLYDIIDEPFHGALWAGPPFRNDTWRRITAQRDPGSPAWLPTFRGGSVVRFMNQEQGLDRGSVEWGAFRIAFLQYASDPITFFNPHIAWTEPDWMREPRGPDVSPDLRWFPVVTMLQLAADTMFGTAPKGFGHEYAPEHYIDAWLALTEPAGWSESDIDQLKSYFKSRQSD
ncbi:alpha/beta hydrolase [Nitrincola alkalilacustris]|uniref:alpha/beta hydrolase n=1 Tax=Nitrincola alkalilacustris TaxID=1571224 RepID=UPI00124EBE9F|nr:alpha/beta-hydrolase family protein [Nitrincola alkalilacustris]